MFASGAPAEGVKRRDGGGKLLGHNSLGHDALDPPSHGVDAEGATVLRKQLRRAQVLAFFSRLRPCLVGLEACATAHYWARELRALGHDVRLMPAQ